MKIDTCNWLGNGPGREYPPGKDEISEFTRTVEIDQTRECPVREMGYVGFWKKIRIKRGNGESICRQIRLMKTK